MFYTFSQADYNLTQLECYLAHLTSQDAILLWQDGVLLALKYPHLFAHPAAPCYILDLDVQARGLTEYIPSYIQQSSLSELVKLSERYFPQFAL